ncbi:MAG TPA: TraB/GumN family protein [Gammaproteobacteria bacterium]|nr:TraB/GumN family protein [Gammaproteobacteria bacterium]
MEYARHRLRPWITLASSLVLATLVLCSQALAAPSQQPDAIALGQGLLWKVEKQGQQPSYVFGTMHVGDAEVTTLAPPVQQAFSSARVLLTELKMDYATIAAVMRNMYYGDERTLLAITGQELFEQVAERLAALGISRQAALKMRPWAVMSVLGVAQLEDGGASAGQGLDIQLYTDAMRQGKQVEALETADEQLAVFENLPKQAKVDMVRSVVADKQKTRAEFKKIREAYLARDLKRLMEMAVEEANGEYGQFMQAFNREGIVERNHRMITRMQKYLDGGAAFVAVGALHLPGDTGILRLLEQRGFRVTPVY